MLDEQKSFERIERPAEKLDRLLGNVANDLNEELKGFSETPLFDNDGTIKMESFEGFGNEADKEKIFSMDREFSRADIPSVQDLYRKEYGAQTAEEIIGQYRKNRENSASTRLEKAITIIFHRMLKEEFLVARASKYDDYVNGIDNVIINKQTGDVICAFDEVHGQKGQERLAKKEEKILNIARRGGATLKYGITFAKDKETGALRLLKKTIRNIPVFYLGLSSEKLGEVLSGMNYDSQGPPNKIELEVFDELLAALSQQALILEKEKIPQPVLANLSKLKTSLEGMKKNK